MTDRWTNARLTRARERNARARAEFGPLEVHYRRTAAQQDYHSAIELERIRPRLDALAVELTASAREVDIESETERIVNELLPLYAQRLGELDRWFQRLCENAGVPDDDEIVEYWRASLELERLRRALHQATGGYEEVARQIDFVRLLREHWEAIAKERDRAFVVHGPGNKVRLLDRPAWWAQGDQLAKLRAASAARKEPEYAVR